MRENARPDRDLFARSATAAALWGLPLTALVFTGVAPVGTTIRTLIWTLSLASAGIACLVNARRSGRLHCHLTGPLFLLLAAASLLHGTGVLPMGDSGWTLIAMALTLGTLATVVPEWIWGRYGRGGCC